jgi:hypothetical protein
VKRIRLLSLPDPRLDRGDSQWEANWIDYRTMIEQVIRVPLNRQTGATIEEMRKGIRVLDALDRTIGDAPLELEDADWQHLKDKTENMPWAMVDRRILQFTDDVTGATDTVSDRAPANGRLVNRS